MANANPTRLGQINATGDDKALFLKTYAGEVLTAYVEEYKLAGKISERNISSGKSASFPTIGTIGSGYHTPGTEITGRIVEANEIIISLDPMLISDAFIANIDEAMNHYDVRSEYTRQQGAELARQRQMNELRCVVQAARTTVGPVPGQPGGARIVAATAKTDATVLANALKAARQTLDEKNIPESDTAAVMKPAQWYLLASNKDLIDRDYNPNVNGSLADATIVSVARFELIKTMNMPTTDESADAGVLQKYRGDYSKVVSLAFHKSAAGTLKLLDLALEDSYDARRQGTLMLAKFALGHGPLRAASAIEVATA